jgi:quinol monooxygenase YgiN
MSGTISYVFEVAIKEGQYDQFKTVMNEMVEAVWATEPRTLTYDWFINEDRTVCHTYERYVDSAAVMAHLQGVGKRFGARLFSLAEPGVLTIYGHPDEEVKKAFEAFHARFLTPIAELSR